MKQCIKNHHIPNYWSIIITRNQMPFSAMNKDKSLIQQFNQYNTEYAAAILKSLIIEVYQEIYLPFTKRDLKSRPVSGFVFTVDSRGRSAFSASIVTAIKCLCFFLIFSLFISNSDEVDNILPLLLSHLLGRLSDGALTLIFFQSLQKKEMGTPKLPP